MKNTKIEWAHHTLNFWVGCTKISPACDFCYAESWAKRSGHPELWAGERRRTTAANWNQARKWDAEAARLGVRYRVFSNSLADFFDNQVPEEWRQDAWELIARCQHLDWMLLTKRPQNIAKMLPVMDSKMPGYRPWNQPWPWQNVWLGTTCEDQERADLNIPHLISVPAAVKFVSVEPMLGPVDLTAIRRTGAHGFMRPLDGRFNKIDLVICGGESGGHARPMHPDWARSLRDQCAIAGVAFHFKQWGEFSPYGLNDERWMWMPDGTCEPDPLPNGIGRHSKDGFSVVYRVGKTRAGRLLDGRTWDQMPGDMS